MQRDALGVESERNRVSERPQPAPRDCYRLDDGVVVERVAISEKALD